MSNEEARSTLKKHNEFEQKMTYVRNAIIHDIATRDMPRQEKDLLGGRIYDLQTTILKSAQRANDKNKSALIDSMKPPVESGYTFSESIPF